MNTREIEQLKERIIELDPSIEFDINIDDKLIGYAERFGCEIIPLYQNVNTFLFKNVETTIREISKLSDKFCQFCGLDDSVVGYVVLEEGVAILHDKEMLINNIALQYMEDGMEIDEDDSYYSQAIEWYDFNIIGTGMSDVLTPAFACTEEWPLPKV